MTQREPMTPIEPNLMARKGRCPLDAPTATSVRSFRIRSARTSVQVTNAIMEVLHDELERAGLRSHVGKADVLRAIREYVFESLLGALWERITEIESKPDVIARLTVSTRESMLELLAEYTR